MVRSPPQFASDFFIYVVLVGWLLSTSATAVGGRAEENHPSGRWFSVEAELACLDTEGLLAWCGIHTCDATTQLGDRSARVPMKVVTSCDKLRVGACMPKIRRWLNRTSCFFGNGRVSDREPTELKHLSRWRK